MKVIKVESCEQCNYLFTLNKCGDIGYYCALLKEPDNKISSANIGKTHKDCPLDNAIVGRIAPLDKDADMISVGGSVWIGVEVKGKLDDFKIDENILLINNK